MVDKHNLVLTEIEVFSTIISQLNPSEWKIEDNSIWVYEESSLLQVTSEGTYKRHKCVTNRQMLYKSLVESFHSSSFGISLVDYNAISSRIIIVTFDFEILELGINFRDRKIYQYYIKPRGKSVTYWTRLVLDTTEVHRTVFYSDVLYMKQGNEILMFRID